jgi:hypothetical protein
VEVRRHLSAPLRVHLTEQLQGNIYRLEVVNAHYRDCSRESSRTKVAGVAEGAGYSGATVVPMAIAQVLLIRDLTGSCLYRATSDHRLLCGLRDEAEGFSKLSAELHHDLDAELKVLHGAIKTQRTIAVRLHECEVFLNLCTGLVGELQQRISLNLDQGQGINENSAITDDVSRGEQMAIMVVLQEKLRMLSSKLRHLAQHGILVKENTGEMLQVLGNAEAYHNFYARKLSQLEQACGEYAQRVNGVAECLHQRSKDLAVLGDKLSALEFTSKDLQRRYQQSVELSEHYRRTMHEHQVVTIHCEQALRALVKSLGSELTQPGEKNASLGQAAMQHLDELQSAREQLSKVFG